METGLLLLRVALGGIIAVHGAQKLFGWFGGPGISGTAGWLEMMGMRPGRRPGTLPERARGVRGRRAPRARPAHPDRCGGDGRRDVVAIATVHWKNGFFNTNGGYEFNLLIVAAALALAFTGPGTISIDHLAGWTWQDPNGASRHSGSPWSPRDPSWRCASLQPSRHKTRRP